MQEINLQLTVEETNLVLEGVGQLPFARVYALIAKMQEQAAEQLRPAPPVELPRPAVVAK
jgi:hypothetical protein